MHGAGLLCLIFTQAALAVPWGWLALAGGCHRDERRARGLPERGPLSPVLAHRALC